MACTLILRPFAAYHGVLYWRAQRTLCDPGLFLSDLSDPAIKRGVKVGLIPHHADNNDRKAADTVNLFLDDDAIHMIDPRTKNFVYVANQIKECRHLYSASLHGLSVADALGIPNTWVVSKKTRSTRRPKSNFLITSCPSSALMFRRLRFMSCAITRRASARLKH